MAKYISYLQLNAYCHELTQSKKSLWTCRRSSARRTLWVDFYDLRERERGRAREQQPAAISHWTQLQRDLSNILPHCRINKNICYKKWTNMEIDNCCHTCLAQRHCARVILYPSSFFASRCAAAIAKIYINFTAANFSARNGVSGASWAEESWAVKRGGETPHSVSPTGDNWSRILQQQLCEEERSLLHFITSDMETEKNRKGGIPVNSVGEEQCCWVWPVSIQAAMSENRLNSQTGYPKTWLRNDESDTHLALNQYWLIWHSQNWW